jgi:hypothetical protein
MDPIIGWRIGLGCGVAFVAFAFANDTANKTHTIQIHHVDRYLSINGQNDQVRWIHRAAFRVEEYSDGRKVGDKYSLNPQIWGVNEWRYSVRSPYILACLQVNPLNFADTRCQRTATSGLSMPLNQRGYPLRTMVRGCWPYYSAPWVHCQNQGWREL